MPLTPDEEKRLREQIRAELERRLQREQSQKEDIDAGRQEKLEERLRQQIREEEEERFYQERGFVKYINHRGGVEWLPLEEAEIRQMKRRSKKGSSRRRMRQRRRIMQWVVNLAAVGFAMMVFWYLWRYNPIQQKRTGNIVIKTNVPGAQVFINGLEKRGVLTPDTLPEMSAGAYFIAVYKDGFTVWPPMQRLSLQTGKTAVAEFELKSTGRMGTLAIQTNESDFDLFVDGVKYPVAANGQVPIPAGHHVVTVVKDGYLANPLYRHVLVSDQGVTAVAFQLEKRADIGFLKVSSNRASAYIYLTNQFSGIKANGESFPVKAGVYEIRLLENGYSSIPVAELVRIMPGETAELSFHLQPETHVDTLQLITPHPGANIILNGQTMPYMTPYPDLALSRGTHFLNLMRDGIVYAEKDLQIDLSHLKDRRLVVDF